ncbi:MAG: glycerol-3-phosphate 1-O-acyltransferase PlsY [Gemmatimonadota bacterium]|nr:glycerol-3-phosphate 1-O-acyltransferase PlsY [Gemmatimonadota bacterium]
MTHLLLIAAAYLIGAFPTSFLIGKWHGVDLSDEGSGNFGATNVYRVLGFLPALTVVSIDLLKGFAPVWYFPQWDGRTGAWELAYGAAAIVGHCWPVYTKFRGGKGVATAAGTLLAVAPVALLIALFVWIGTLLLTRIASLASLMSATLIPLLARGAEAPTPIVLYALCLSALVWWTHRSNLVRLAQRKELRIRFGKHSGYEDEEGNPIEPLNGDDA